MFEEAQRAADVHAAGDRHTVLLGADHPGVADPVYRARRDDLATLAAGWRVGDVVPDAPYTEDEHAVWAAVSADLVDKHERLSCKQFRDGKAALGLPTDRVPQLREVSERLAALTGFGYRPAAGLVPLRQFYEALADRAFHSTQYVRHHSVPLYTPEPDVIHEVAGHGNTLANPRYAALYVAAGEAARRLETDAALEFLSRTFWFTLEFGVLHEPDGLKAYGAGILSSPGEIEEFRSMTVRPLDLVAMGTAAYDITAYQDVLYAADSFGQLEDVVGGFWAGMTDDTVAALVPA